MSTRNTPAVGVKRWSTGATWRANLQMTLSKHLTKMMRSKGILRGLPSAAAKEQFPGAIQLKRVGVLQKERQRNDTLFLDYDEWSTPRLLRTFYLLHLWHMRPRFVCDIRTRRGWHRVIRLRERLTNAEIVACQVLLGSDPGREALNLMRCLSIRKDGAGDFASARWNLLFSRKLCRRRKKRDS